MMKYRYRFHPNDYALGENEKFYSDMEAAGWHLVNRGANLSKFERCEPSAARYRIEVSTDSFMGESDLSEAQVMVYEDCGWEYVTCHGLLHIFRAPAGSDAPEFYTDPRQQATTLKKLRRNYLLAWLPLVIMLGLNFSLTLALRGDVNEIVREMIAKLERGWVTTTALHVCLLTVLLWAVYQMIRGAVHISITYHRMKRGIPLDHAPTGRKVLYRLLNYATTAVILVCGVLTLWQLIDYERYDLPAEADGPYLMLGDLGIEGERGYLFYRDKTSDVEHARSPLAEFWLTREVLNQPDGELVWMDQQAYQLRQPERAVDFAHTLMELAIFIRDSKNFRPVDAPGLDAAWVGGMEAVAVKDGLVIYVVCSSAIYDDMGMERAVLPALAEIWS